MICFALGQTGWTKFACAPAKASATRGWQIKEACATNFSVLLNKNKGS